MVQSFYTEIEISLPPLEVKKLFLNFASFPKFHDRWTLRALDAEKTTIEPGDRLEIDVQGTKLQPVVLENNEEHLYWRGNFAGLVKGKHMWRFLESQDATNRGGTTFVQAEDFNGVLEVVFSKYWPSWLGGQRGKTEEGFRAFNQDFKGWCERERR